MVKKIIVLLFFLLLFPKNVFAVHEVIDARCTTSLKTLLRQEAQDIVYRLSKVDEDGVISYTAYFYNFTDNVIIKDSSDNIYDTGIIENLKPGSALVLSFYASDNNYCSGYKISSRVINVPYYNPYFGSDICKGYESFLLCQENVDVSLTQNQFEEKLQEYKESLIKDEIIVDDVIDDDSFSFYDFLYTYGMYIIGVILFIVITILIYIINKKRKNRGIL